LKWINSDQLADLYTADTSNCSIVGGFPLLFIIIMLGWSFMKASTSDIQASEQYKSKTINLNCKKILERLKRRKRAEKDRQLGPVDAHFEGNKNK
jgi:betaine/carnitine transporter, BCCT family